MLAEWIGEGGNPVDRSLAEKRASVCKACPFNKPAKRKLEKAVAEAILEQEEVRHSLDLTLPDEGSLGACGVCQCYLKLKVWVPLKHISNGDFPEACWIRQERIPKNMRYAPEDAILSHYRGLEPVTKNRRRPVFNDAYTLTNVAQGLGDCLILTDVWNASGRTVRPYSNSRHFPAVTAFMPGWTRASIRPLMIDYPTANVTWDLGNGHNLQRIRRMFGIPVDLKPKPDISVAGSMKNPKKVVIHLDPGVHVNWQRANVHPRARMVYPENVRVIAEWARSSGMDCVTVGGVMIPGVRHVHTETTEQLIMEIASASWFLGIMSGPLHLATGLGLRCVVVINFPDPRKIFLPTLVTTGQVEEEWFYPQHVHLHQDGDGPLVPRFDARSLRGAFAGEVYPFWEDKWLGLIDEKI